MYHALTVGSYGTEYMMNKIMGGTELDLLQVIAGEAMLKNVLEFEQYKLLEAIALATATNIGVNRDDAIKTLNQKIRQINGR